MKKHPFGCYSAIFKNPRFAGAQWWGMLIAIGIIRLFFKIRGVLPPVSLFLFLRLQSDSANEAAPRLLQR
jgi:hypothetical protein